MSNMMKSIVIIIDYFADQWPEWFPVYFESIRYNPSVNWIFHTNCDCTTYKSDNAAFHNISIEDYNWDAFANAMIQLPLNKLYDTSNAFYKAFNWATIVRESILYLPK